MSQSLRFALLGHPVGHSVSPAIHAAAYRALGASHRYDVCDCPTPDAVRAQVARVRSRELWGVNVTVPWKRLAFELADRADDSARATGVANVLSCDPSGHIVASNTDAGALTEEIQSLHRGPRSAAVIGAGGAAQAAVVACRSIGISTIAVSSRGFRLDTPREEWTHAGVFEALGASAWAWPEHAGDRRAGVLSAFMPRADVIIQATSAGMRGAGPGAAVSDWIPWRELPAGAAAIDVVYNPAITPFLEAAQAAGVAHRGGLGMLVRQAALALRLWLGGCEGWVEPELGVLWAAAEAALAEQVRS